MRWIVRLWIVSTMVSCRRMLLLVIPICKIASIMPMQKAGSPNSISLPRILSLIGKPAVWILRTAKVIECRLFTVWRPLIPRRVPAPDSVHTIWSTNTVIRPCRTNLCAMRFRWPILPEAGKRLSMWLFRVTNLPTFRSLSRTMVR